MSTLLDPAAVTVHRAINEVAGGRAVRIVDGEETFAAAPLDGGPVLSDTLALAAPRVRHLGIGDGALLVRAQSGASLHSLANAPQPLPMTVIPGATRLAEAATELAKLAERLPAMTVAPNAPDGALTVRAHDIIAYRKALAETIAPVASAKVPLASGAISTVTAFRNAAGGTASAVVVGEPTSGALVRIHSSCITGDVFGSLKCDCGAQLSQALSLISEQGGVLIYTAQEGRGIGLVNKLRAYTLQDGGLDTVDANLALGYHDDERDYVAAARILMHLGLPVVRLITNNPSKVDALADMGISVTAVPIVTPPTEHNRTYLETKRRRSRHAL